MQNSTHTATRIYRIRQIIYRDTPMTSGMHTHLTVENGIVAEQQTLDGMNHTPIQFSNPAAYTDLLGMRADDLPSLGYTAFRTQRVYRDANGQPVIRFDDGSYAYDDEYRTEIPVVDLVIDSTDPTDYDDDEEQVAATDEYQGRCAYCGAPQTDVDTVPDVDDDAGWAELAHTHAQGCEWIETRAHRI